MSVRVRCHDPAELLPLVPYLLSFTPARSLVLLYLAAGRVILTARVDLPPSEHAVAAADSLLRVRMAAQPDAILIIGYEATPGESDPLADHLDRRLSTCGIAVLDRITVRDGRWYRPEQPAQGHPVPELGSTAAEAELVAAGVAVPAADRADIVTRFEAGPRAAAVGEECDRLADLGNDRPDAALAAWRQVLSADRVADVPPAALAAAAVALNSTAFRDQLLARLLPGTLDPDGLGSAAAFEEVLPTSWLREQAAGALGRLTGLAASLPERHAAPALTVAAAVAWSQGFGADARVALARVERAQPGYPLAGLLTQLIDRGLRLPALAV